MLETLDLIRGKDLFTAPYRAIAWILGSNLEIGRNDTIWITQIILKPNCHQLRMQHIKNVFSSISGAIFLSLQCL